jgi:hypothetical protein
MVLLQCNMAFEDRMRRYATHAHLPPVWKTPKGEPVSCAEKIKVLNQNFVEIEQLAQYALEDAILMGCDEDQVRKALHGLVDQLKVRLR